MNKRQLYENIMRNVSREVKKVLNENIQTISENEFIDLGLPSGTLWCNHNIGATCGISPESWYGGYYAWGETETKNEYNDITYKYSDQKGNKYYKYNTFPTYGRADNKMVLTEDDDIAYIEYSGSAYMPTKEQVGELIRYTEQEWVNDYNGIFGLNGMLFTGENGNSIFIPAAGFFYNSDLCHAESFCSLWSSTLSNDSTYALNLGIDFNNDCHISGVARKFGCSVRAVCD